MKSRVIFLLVLTALWGGAVVARLVELQWLQHDAYAEMARRQHHIEVDLAAPRGTIYDAAGRELAVSVTVESAYLRTEHLEDSPERLLERLEGIPGVQSQRLLSRIAQGKPWSWVARKLSPAAAADLRERAIPGVRLLKESHRFYPKLGSAAAVLGFVGTDGVGLEGLELRYDQVLAGAKVRRTLLRDARKGTLQVPGVSFRDAEPGADLHLTLDAVIQHHVERELARAVAEHRAQSGSAVFLDPRTGAVLAMASVPGYDPNRFTEFSAERRMNRVIRGDFEPGSTFKMVTAAAALEANLVDPLDLVDCEMGAVTVAGRRIRDHKPFGVLSFRDVIARSSNVGAIKVGLTVGGERLARQAEAFGFGRRTGVDLPSELSGLVHADEMRRELGTAYASFGQSFTATPLQMAAAFAAVANGGELYRPYVVAAIDGRTGRREIAPQRVGRPIGAATARTLERLLEAVVDVGTGTAAAVPGYRVAGKTGTAQVADPDGGGYLRDRHVASFVGFVPARDPVILGAIAIHSPVGLYHGGEVAAPVFSRMARDVLVYLGVTPDAAAEPPPPPAPAPRLARRLRPEPPPGTLPDLTGLTAREAVARAGALGISPRLAGHGVVVRQQPPAGTPLAEAGQRVEIWLDSGAGR